MPTLPRCPTHGRLSLSLRRRRSTVGTETEFSTCLDDAGNVLKDLPIQRSSHQGKLRDCASGVPGTKDTEDFRDSKLSHCTQLDEDHASSDGSYLTEAERASNFLSCSCSCIDIDANDFAVTSSSVIIEDRQLAVVDRELRNLRKTLVRKLYSRLTKISGFGRKMSINKPAS